MTTKLTSFSKTNSTQLHALTGQMFIDRDAPEENNWFHKDEHNSIFYDDETVFTFNHPKRSNLAAIQKTDEIQEDAEEIYMEQLKKYGLEELTEE